MHLVGYCDVWVIDCGDLAVLVRPRAGSSAQQKLGHPWPNYVGHCIVEGSLCSSSSRFFGDEASQQNSCATMSVRGSTAPLSPMARVSHGRKGALAAELGSIRQTWCSDDDGHDVKNRSSPAPRSTSHVEFDTCKVLNHTHSPRLDLSPGERKDLINSPSASPSRLSPAFGDVDSPHALGLSQGTASSSSW